MIEHLGDHPDEVQGWVYHAHWWSPRMPLHSRLFGFLFQGEDGWREQSGNHMAWRHGADTFSAEWPALRPRPAAEEAAAPGQIIHAFAFEPALSEEESARLQRWILAQLNKPYDVWLCTNRGLRALWRLQGRVLPVVDFSGDTAMIGYEYAARGINFLNRPGLHVDPAMFGPPDLWALAHAGKAVYRGRVVFTTT